MVSQALSCKLLPLNWYSIGGRRQGPCIWSWWDSPVSSSKRYWPTWPTGLTIGTKCAMSKSVVTLDFRWETRISVIRLFVKEWRVHSNNSAKSMHSYRLTRSTESRAARANMSAQDTTPRHVASNWDLASSITSNPLRPKFCGAVLSDDAPEIKTEASHPYISCEQKHMSDTEVEGLEVLSSPMACYM